MKPGNSLRLATGPVEGTYFRFGKYLREFAPDSQLRPCTTDGSLENLELLNDGKVDFAIVQGDLMHRGWSREEAPAQYKTKWQAIDFDSLRLVRRLYSERLQVVAGPHSYISSLADLRKKRVWLGRPASGTFATAWEVLRAAGLERGEVNELQEGITSYKEANAKLLEGKLDAVFRITSVPLDFVREENENDPNYPATLTYLFQRNAEVHLIGVDQALLGRILESPSYVEVPIYRGTYAQQKDGVMTVGIEALLVTRLNRPEDDRAIAELNRAISDSRSQIQRQINIELDLLDRKLDPAGEPEDKAVAARVHPAARSILLEGRYGKYEAAAVSLLVMLILMAFLLRSKTALERLGGSTKYLVAGGFLIAACGVFGVGLWFFERRFSFNFHNPMAAAESLLVYFARGLKTDTLMTQQGQLIALLALAVIATLVHSINSDALEEGVRSWSKKLARWFYRRAAGVRPDERHLVILNWDQRASDKVGEWMKDPMKAKNKITIVSPDIAELPLTTQSERIEVLRGDPKLLSMLEKARVEDAKFVLICSTWSRRDPLDRRRSMDVELADNYTIRAIQGIRALEWKSHSKRAVAIDAEIYLESNRHAAQSAGGQETDIKAPRGGLPTPGMLAPAGVGQAPRPN